MAKASRVAAKQADSMEMLAQLQVELAERLTRMEETLNRLEERIGNPSAGAAPDPNTDPKKAK